jgi:hypothetical protein
MLPIGASNWALKAASLQSLHPNSDSIGVPVQELDPIQAMVQEHEQATIAHVALKVILNDPEETVEALAHIDWLGMQVNGNRRVESEHGNYAT